MPVNRTNAIDPILYNLSLAANDSDGKQITLLHGGFGTGKSWIVSNIDKELLRKNYIHATLRCDTHKDIAFVPDFAMELAKNMRLYNTTAGQFEFGETEFVHTKFFENLIKIKESDFESFNKIVKKILFKSLSDKTLEEYNRRRQPEKTEDISPIFDSFFEKNSDKALMKNIDEYVAEALIVDIMNHFFRLGERYPSYEAYLDTELPKKILVIADDFDPIAGSALRWLLDVFIPYCNNKSFHQFISYDFQGGRSNIKVSDFLDFRFLFCTRQNISSCKAAIDLENTDNTVANVELLPFNSEETAELITSYHLPVEIDINEAMELTSGIPLIIALWLESKSYANNNFHNFILPLVIDKIFRYSADYEIEWIKNSAFLDSIDSDSLRCFHAFEGSAEKAAFYFEQMSSLAVRQADNTLSIHPLLKKYIKLSTEQNSQQQYEELCAINTIANTQRELLLPFTSDDKKLVAELAYYNRFDPDFVPEYAFGGQSTEVKRIIAEYPHFFTENGSYTAFKPEVYAQLTKYNRLTDKENAAAKEESVKQCWEEYLKYLAVKNENIDAETTSLQARLETEEMAYKENKLEYTNLQVKFMRDESELIELRVTIADYSINKSLYSTISYFSIAVILGVAGFFITDLFTGSPSINSIEMIQKIMYGAACLFAFVGLVFMGKMLFSSSKVEYEKLNRLYTGRMENKEQMQQEMTERRTALDAMELKVKNMKDRHSELVRQKQTNLEKVNEPFYQ